MTNESRNRFSVVTNEELIDKEKNSRHSARDRFMSGLSSNRYQTNPLKEQLCKFANEEGGRKFTVEDLLKW